MTTVHDVLISKALFFVRNSEKDALGKCVGCDSTISVTVYWWERNQLGGGLSSTSLTQTRPSSRWRLS